jgi:hypothetical protein
MLLCGIYKNTVKGHLFVENIGTFKKFSSVINIVSLLGYDYTASVAEGGRR